ncbi:hypothetical protein ACHZ97_04100 [Lysobacter soli]|uniref:hypothetical protein n=1 Tax=Lysobacter soli TaxID=453783 RepID=UPI0037C7EB95
MAGEIREGFKFTMADGSVKGLGVDDDGNLYWDKKPVEIKQRISFGWIVNSAAVVAALATAVQAVIDVLQFYGVSAP